MKFELFFYKNLMKRTRNYLLSKEGIARAINEKGFIPVVNDVILIAYFIKAQTGKFPRWINDFNFDEYNESRINMINKSDYTRDHIRTFFNFVKPPQKIIKPEIRDYAMPVFGTWIEKIGDTLVLHEDGTGRFLNYSNAFFNLQIVDPKQHQLSLNSLDKTWNLDLWMFILNKLNGNIKIFGIDYINVLSLLHIEIIRSLSVKKQDANLYDSAKAMIKVIYQYMFENNLTEIDYNNYEHWPIEVKDCMNQLVEGNKMYYLGTQKFYRIKFHYLPVVSLEDNIRYLTNYVLNADSKIENGLFTINLDVDFITKLIYNINENPTITIVLNTTARFLGRDIQLMYNKIDVLYSIYVYVLQISEKFVKAIKKLKIFCKLWRLLKSRNETIIQDTDLKLPFVFEDDMPDYVVLSKIARSQSSIHDLIQAIGYYLIISISGNTIDYLILEELRIIDSFINEKICFDRIEGLTRLSIETLMWINHEEFEKIGKIASIFNYTPAKINKDLPKQLILHEKFELLKQLKGW